MVGDIGPELPCQLHKGPASSACHPIHTTLNPKPENSYAEDFSFVVHPTPCSMGPDDELERGPCGTSGASTSIKPYIRG